jgi:hypothetical protein
MLRSLLPALAWCVTDAGLIELNIEEPSRPYTASWIRLPGLRGIASVGRNHLLAYGPSGVWLVTSSTSPKKLSAVRVRDAAAAGNSLYVLSNDALLTVRVDGAVTNRIPNGGWSTVVSTRLGPVLGGAQGIAVVKGNQVLEIEGGERRSCRRMFSLAPGLIVADFTDGGAAILDVHGGRISLGAKIARSSLLPPGDPTVSLAVTPDREGIAVWSIRSHRAAVAKELTDAFRSA